MDRVKCCYNCKSFVKRTNHDDFGFNLEYQCLDNDSIHHPAYNLRIIPDNLCKNYKSKWLPY
jgi:hypothetical protein